MPFPSQNSRPFCPPIFFVQILLERISSPWEPNFAALPSLQVLFSPQNSQPPLSAPNGQIHVGQGRLFFIRPISSNSELGWLELRGKAGAGNLPSKWMGRVDLDQIGKNGPIQVNCPLKSASGPSLEAHLVLNVGEVEQKNGRENLGKELTERGIQTEAGIRKAEMGTQTTMEEMRRKEGKMVVGKEPQFSRKTMLRLLVLMMLRARKGAEGRKPKMESRSTLTRVSIPPKGDELLNILNNKKRTEIGHCRARIGYLSAVHRTMVPRAKEPKMEKNLRKMKKRENGEQIRRGREGNGGREENGILDEGKLATRIRGMESAAFLDEGRRSSSSSGLQSMAMESGRKAPEEGGGERRIGFRREEEWRTTENAKRNDRELREGFVQNNQNRSNVTGGSRFSTLNSKAKAKSSSSSSSSASKTHQQEQLSSLQRGNGTNIRKDISSSGVDENKEGSKSISSSSHSSSSSSASSSTPSHHSQSKSGSKSSLASARQKEGQSSESGSSKSVSSKTDSSIMEMVASSVKTDSSVPVEIQSAAASSSGSNSGTMVSGGGEGRERRQSSTSRFLQDLRKQVLNNL